MEEVIKIKGEEIPKAFRDMIGILTKMHEDGIDKFTFMNRKTGIALQVTIKEVDVKEVE